MFLSWSKVRSESLQEKLVWFRPNYKSEMASQEITVNQQLLAELLWPEEFSKMCETFCTRQNSLNSSGIWKMRVCVKDCCSEEQIYLVTKRQVVQELSFQSLPKDDKLNNICVPEEEDISCLEWPRLSSKTTLFFEYHIVLSPTYQVPVLYFNATYPNGAIVSQDEIFSIVSNNVGTIKDPWSMVTQEEHPILGTPFFYVHPCKTAEVMKQVQKMHQQGGNESSYHNYNFSECYLTSWLSIYGPIIGLNVSLPSPAT